MKKTFYDQKYFEERNYLDPKIASAVENLANEHHAKKILDVGCGTGKLVMYLNKLGFNAKGCDPYIRGRKSKTLIRASATKLPFGKKTFDLITSISVIEHLTKSEVRQFLSEAKRVLKNRGNIFLVTPNYLSIWRVILGKKWFGYSDPTHVNFYTPSSLSKLLKKNGLKNIRFSFKIKNLSFVDYLLVTTLFWRIRNSFYIAAQKYEKT